MRLSRTRFVLLFLAFGYAFHFVVKFWLKQSAILSPINLVLFGPIDWLQQDPDPPPPLRLMLCGVYWSVLALCIHELLRRMRVKA